MPKMSLKYTSNVKEAIEEKLFLRLDLAETLILSGSISKSIQFIFLLQRYQPNETETENLDRDDFCKCLSSFRN